MSQPAFHSDIIPGLDVLIGDPGFLTPRAEAKKKAEILHVPYSYISQLLGFYDEQTTRGESARELISIFGRISETTRATRADYYVCDNGMRLKFEECPNDVFLKSFPSQSRNSSNFNTIAVAKALQQKYGAGNVAIMTGSDKLATLASLNGVDIARINPDVYSGRTSIHIPDDIASLWQTNHYIPEKVLGGICPKPLIVNQYVELSFSQTGYTESAYQNIGRFNGEAIVPLRHAHIAHPAFHRIRPQTPGQAMLFDALLAPVEEVPIVIVSGTFGTGKTFCTVAAGLAQVLERQYDQLFVCPRDGALGREIGFLKGDKLDKVLPMAAPVIDNLREVLKLIKAPEPDANTAESDDLRHGKKKKGARSRYKGEFTLKALTEDYLSRYFEFEPIIYMGGRSIGNSWIVLDESQDLERGQMRALLSRIGNGSKIIVLGDPDQTTNPHLNRTSNGLSWAASRLAGDPLAAVVSFDESLEVVRSEAARHIAERLASQRLIDTI